MRKSVFGRFPWTFRFYTIHEAHKQYSLLDTIFKYILYFEPSGKQLYLSPQNPLHVGRRNRLACSRSSWGRMIEGSLFNSPLTRRLNNFGFHAWGAFWKPAVPFEFCLHRLLPKPGCKEIGFRLISLNKCFYTINEAHKQYRLLDIFVKLFLFILDLQENIYEKTMKSTACRPASPADM